jgi:hypothetical protein
MSFILGLLVGYCIRGKQRLLIGTLTAIAIVVFIVLPAIALFHNLPYQLGANDSHNLHKQRCPRSSVWTTKQRK